MQNKFTHAKQQITFGILKYKQELIFIAILISIIFLPSVIHNQFITGTIINALLLITVILLNKSKAIYLGFIPSIVALGSGLLPMPLAPMLPFIIISNTLYITLYNKFYKKNVIISIVISSIVKFIFLSTFIILLGQILFDELLLAKVTLMMTWSQLITSVLGGLVASALLKFFKQNEQTTTQKT